MKKCTYLVFILCWIAAAPLGAQEISYGFKAGLDFSSLKGPLENDDAGNTVEKHKSVSGFHVGGGINVSLNEKFGWRTELLFAQKGGKYLYDGQAYRIFTADSGHKIYSTGTMRSNLSISNAYIDLPVMVFAKPLRWLEFSAGVNVGALIISTGTGEIYYKGTTTGGTVIDEFVLTLDHKYFSDKAGGAKLGTPVVIKEGNETVNQPRQLGAYYDYASKSGSFFNIFDLGVDFGISLYLNKSLYLGYRLNYGLLDATNNKYDISKVKLNGVDYISRSDKDVNLSNQISIGFYF